jgi:hypothetical protein
MLDQPFVPTKAWRIPASSPLEDAAELPAHGDALKILPLSGQDGGQVQVLAHGRRIPGRDLAIWYRVTESEVSLEALPRAL